MSHIDDNRGRAVITLVQGVSMIEVGALPLWVGVLMGHYGFDPKEAGMLISLYMGGSVIAGLTIASFFGRLSSGKFIAYVGMVCATLTFFLITQFKDFEVLSILHFCGGLSLGPVLAICQGTIGRSLNPHRLFAIVAVASTTLAAIFLGIMPSFVDRLGGVLFFQVVAGILALGAILAILGFPAAPITPSLKAESLPNAGKLTLPILLIFAGLICLSVVFSMTMSFVERVGMQREYGLAAVSAVLSAMAIMKLTPAAIAGLMQKKLSVRSVLLVVPIVQALCSALIYGAAPLAVYAIAAPLFVTTMMFAQVFAFGLISKLDTSGRASALSASLLMVGMTIGPILGGIIVKAHGYALLAFVSPIVAAIAILLFHFATRRSRTSETMVSGGAR